MTERQEHDADLRGREAMRRELDARFDARLERPGAAEVVSSRGGWGFHDPAGYRELAVSNRRSP